MTDLPGRSEDLSPVRFQPTGGTASGYAGIALVLVPAAYLLLTEPGLRSTRIALVFALLAVVFWIGLVRPRASATTRTLTLRNMLRDTHIPLAAVDTVAVRQMLMVWVGDDRYTCVGIGHPLRQSKKQARSRGATGVQGHGGGAAGLVAQRIEQLATAARYDARGELEATTGLRHTWAWPELTLLALLTTGLLLTFVVG